MVSVLQIPGGLELLVIFLITILVFGIPVAVVVLGVVLLRGSRGDGDVEEEVAALREEVAELRASVRGDTDAGVATGVRGGAAGEEDGSEETDEEAD